MKIGKRMVHGCLVIFIILFACLVIITLSEGVSAETFTVDDDGNANFTSIRQAIENASDGDTIRVYAGTYHENVVVDRSVILQGNGSGTTIIDGHGGEYVLNITADGVNISGFHLKNATTGIVISSDENIITGNKCINNTNGIYIGENCDGNSLDGNNCSSNTGSGIRSSTSRGTIIRNNICTRNQHGINLTGSDAQVRNNTVSGNEIGMNLRADNITLENNTITDNEMGIYVWAGAESNQAHNNNIFRNSEYGIQVTDNDGFSINATMNWWGTNSGPYHSNNQEGKGNAVSDLVLFDPWVIKQQDYQVSFSRDQEIFVVSPDRYSAGEYHFTLTVFNEGNVTDTFSFELAEDAETTRFGHWLNLPHGVSIEPGKLDVVEFVLTVHPYYIDKLALADGILKNITFRVYSNGARESNLEVEGETTDSFLCQVFIEEYRYASFTAISPSIQSMRVSETRTVNVTLQNEGNGQERYYLHKKGEDGQGAHTNWYEFNRTSVLLQPLESVQLSIHVAPSNPLDEIHNLHFYAQSETHYSTDEEDFTIDVEESFGGYFISWDEAQSNPGRTVYMRLTVRNTGNHRHTFILDSPEVPEGWDTPIWQGESKIIDAYSSEDFTLEIKIPSDFTCAEAGLYQFEINGWYEDFGGNLTQISGTALLNLTVTPYFLFTMDSPVESKDVIPGEQCQFIVEIRNQGNYDDIIVLDLLEVSNREDAIQWTTMDGPDPEGTIQVPVGDMVIVILNVTVPEFSIQAEDPMADLYGFKVRAYSQAEPGIEREITFEIEVREVYNLTLWCENPSRNVTKGSNEEIHLYYTISVRNLGNAYDEIAVTIPGDEFQGARSGWEFQIGGMSTNIILLDSLAQTSTTLDLTIDSNTPSGHYALQVSGRSIRDSNAHDEIYVFINISKPNYDLEFDMRTEDTPSVNPANGPEVEYSFTITNTGNYYDSYRLEVLTSTLSGSYLGWRVEFEDSDGIRQTHLDIPEDLPDHDEGYINDGYSVDISLYVTPAMDAVEGLYSGIIISMVSDGDLYVREEHNFPLRIIRPNILIDNDPAYFSLIPDTGIREGDKVEIMVRIRNTGNAETGSFYIWFYNGKANSLIEMEGFPIAVERVDTIKPDSETQIMVSWDDIPFGQNDIFVFADKPIRLGANKTEIQGEFNPNGRVMESLESDNFATISEVFREQIDIRPDLEIMEVVFGNPVADSTTRVTVYITNHGSGKAWYHDVSIQVMIDGEYLRDTKGNSPNPSGPDIEPLDTEDRYFTWNVPSEPGNHSVTVFIHCTTSSNGTIEYSTIVTTRESDDERPIISTDPVWFYTILGLLLGIALTIGFLFVSGNLVPKVPGNVTKRENRSASQIDLANTEDTRSFAMDRRSFQEGTHTSVPTMKRHTTGNYIPIPVSGNRPFNPPPHQAYQPPVITADNSQKDDPINCPRCGNMVDPEIPFCVRCGYTNLYVDEDRRNIVEKEIGSDSIQSVIPVDDGEVSSKVDERNELNDGLLSDGGSLPDDRFHSDSRSLPDDRFHSDSRSLSDDRFHSDSRSFSDDRFHSDSRSLSDDRFHSDDNKGSINEINVGEEVVGEDSRVEETEKQ